MAQKNNPKIEVNESPLDQKTLDEIIGRSGFIADMILQYSSDIEGYNIYVRYNQGRITRQVYTQRKQPRSFKDLQRAIDWGKTIGFNTVSLTIDYSDYNTKGK